MTSRTCAKVRRFLTSKFICSTVKIPFGRVGSFFHCISILGTLFTIICDFRNQIVNGVIKFTIWLIIKRTHVIFVVSGGVIFELYSYIFSVWFSWFFGPLPLELCFRFGNLCWLRGRIIHNCTRLVCRSLQGADLSRQWSSNSRYGSWHRHCCFYQRCFIKRGY